MIRGKWKERPDSSGQSPGKGDATGMAVDGEDDSEDDAMAEDAPKKTDAAGSPELV